MTGPADRSIVDEPPHSTRLSLAYDDASLASIVESSLALEVGEIDDARSRTAVSRTEATVVLEIEAADLVALRAAANTWLSLTGVAERAASIADSPG